MGFWTENFNSSNLSPIYEDPNTFVTSQWQWNKDSPNIIYLILRIIIFVAFFTILILSYTMETDEGKNKWAVYLTNWGLTVCTIQSFLSSLMLFCVVLGTSAFEAPQLVSSILKAYKAYWIANVIATTVAFTISFVYWTLIHKAEYWSIMNFMVHGMNSILMFIDFCIVGHPVRLLHFVYPICFTLVYLTMTAIYYACGGTAKNASTYIYPILKWDQPGITIGYCCGVVVVIAVIHCVTYLLYIGKSHLAELCFSGSSSSSEVGDASTQMLHLNQVNIVQFTASDSK